MNAAEIVLTLLGLGRVALELVEKYQRGELTEEQLVTAWGAMQLRLASASDRIRA